MSEEQLKKAHVFGSILIKIIKWLFLISMVTTVGFTLGLIVFSIIYGEKLPVELFEKISGILLPFTQDNINDLITQYGYTKLMIAVIGYGVAASLTGIMSYILADKSVILYEHITVGEVFHKGTDKLLNEMVGISFINTFTLPVIVLIISLITNIFLDEYITVGFGGLIVLIVLFVIKVVVNRGINLNKDNNKYDRVIKDYKADIDELKIQSIKRDSELRKLKAQVKEQEEKLQQKTKKKSIKKTTRK